MEKKKPQGTMDRLVRVAPNLYRHADTDEYYGRRKMAGRRKIHALGTTDRKLADRRLTKWIESLEGVNGDAARITLGELIEQFRRERAGAAQSTRENDEMVIKQMKTTALDDGRRVFDFNARVSRITPSDMQAFMALQGKRGIGPRTFNVYASILSKIFGLAARDQVTSESVYKKAAIKWKKVPRRKPNLPTLEQFEAIVTAIRTNRFVKRTMKPMQRPNARRTSWSSLVVPRSARRRRPDCAGGTWILRPVKYRSDE